MICMLVVQLIACILETILYNKISPYYGVDHRKALSEHLIQLRGCGSPYLDGTIELASRPLIIERP